MCVYIYIHTYIYIYVYIHIYIYITYICIYRVNPLLAARRYGRGPGQPHAIRVNPLSCVCVCVWRVSLWIHTYIYVYTRLSFRCALGLTPTLSDQLPVRVCSCAQNIWTVCVSINMCTAGTAAGRASRTPSRSAPTGAMVRVRVGVRVRARARVRVRVGVNPSGNRWLRFGG